MAEPQRDDRAVATHRPASGPFRPAWPSAPTLSTIPATPRPTPSPTHPNPKSRLPPPYASIHPARSAPILKIQTVPTVDYVALPHHAI